LSILSRKLQKKWRFRQAEVYQELQLTGYFAIVVAGCLHTQFVEPCQIRDVG